MGFGPPGRQGVEITNDDYPSAIPRAIYIYMVYVIPTHIHMYIYIYIYLYIHLYIHTEKSESEIGKFGKPDILEPVQIYGI